MLEKAKNFVYQNGVLWERALFAYLFEGGSLEWLHQCLLCYKNPDHGWAHGMEHDIKTPDSHPLALEYLLRVLVDFEIPHGNLLDGTSEWLELHFQADGTLQNPASLHNYPYAEWWKEGGQDKPNSIIGNLKRLGLATPLLSERVQNWVAKHLTEAAIRSTEWLFMAYHPYDYFFNVADFPEVEKFRVATTETIIKLASEAPPEQHLSFFTFAPTPDAHIAQATPDALLKRLLDTVEAGQQEDGAWRDQHNLPQWFNTSTMFALMTLQRYGRA